MPKDKTEALDEAKKLTDIKPLGISTADKPASGREFLLLRAESETAQDLGEPVQAMVEQLVAVLGPQAPYLDGELKVALDCLAEAGGYGYPEPADAEEPLEALFAAIPEGDKLLANVLEAVVGNEDLTEVKTALESVRDAMNAIGSTETDKDTTEEPDATAEERADEVDDLEPDEGDEDATEERVLRVSATALATTCERVCAAALTDGNVEVAESTLRLMRNIREALPHGGLVTLKDEDEDDFIRSIKPMSKGIDSELLSGLVDYAHMQSLATRTSVDEDAVAGTETPDAADEGVNDDGVADEAVKPESGLGSMMEAFSADIQHIMVSEELSTEQRDELLSRLFAVLATELAGMSGSDTVDASQDAEARAAAVGEEIGAQFGEQLEPVLAAIANLTDEVAALKVARLADNGEEPLPQEPQRRSLRARPAARNTQGAHGGVTKSPAELARLQNRGKGLLDVPMY